MKISYNWLKEYLPEYALKNYTPFDVADLLTNSGLEVEGIETQELVKGGLRGLVVGEVKAKEKHPDADRLSITKVDVGSDQLLNIVCGASNVEEGQKVVVATIGTKLYPTSGEPFEIKKSKIRGVVSEGMICAEDEIGLGTSHDGILVLDSKIPVGTLAKDYFKVESDSIFEIGLTPNRADAASHIGVARDLIAILNSKTKLNDAKLSFPEVAVLSDNEVEKGVEVLVEDVIACPRYSGITIFGVEVKESPAWLKNKLGSIGIKSINNVVDVTNFVLHEMGQPLHAFDADKIVGGKVIVKKVKSKTQFKTLDLVERELSENDLMICNTEGPMCMAGVFGGAESGVSTETKNIFIESAYFDSVHIRKTSKNHSLKTDASFRYERGADPNITLLALKRAILLLKEVAGGRSFSQIVDIYPKPIENFKIAFSYDNCNTLVGKKIDKEVIKGILNSLEIRIVNEGNDGLLLSVPPYRVDVQREADVVEEVLRIYGYDQIEIPTGVRSSISFFRKPDSEKVQGEIANFLCDIGYNEILTNSLTSKEYYQESKEVISVLNPLSTELSVLRKSLINSGLEVIAYNQNRKNSDVKLFEFGNIYMEKQQKETDLKYFESKCLSLFVSGRKDRESWNTKSDLVNFFYLKGCVNGIMSKLGLLAKENVRSDLQIDLVIGKKVVASISKLERTILKKFGIKNEVFCAEFDWNFVLESLKNTSVKYKEVSKFPEVRRDLALLIDKKIQYQELEQLAFQTEKQILKRVNLFDIYEGDNIDSEKKSYAMSFILQDEDATLTDAQTDKVMEKLINTYKQVLGATVR